MHIYIQYISICTYRIVYVFIHPLSFLIFIYIAIRLLELLKNYRERIIIIYKIKVKVTLGNIMKSLINIMVAQWYLCFGFQVELYNF